MPPPISKWGQADTPSPCPGLQGEEGVQPATCCLADSSWKQVCWM